MVAVEFNDDTERYEVIANGVIKARPTTAKRAKKVGKKVGRQEGERVTYQGPRMSSPKVIFRPSKKQKQRGGSLKQEFIEDTKSVLDELGF